MPPATRPPGRSWALEWGTEAGGGFLRWELRPAGRCRFWAALVDAGSGPLVVCEHDLPAPRGRTLEVRGEGLWAEGVCETAEEHWSFGLEAFAVRFDDPAEGLGRERGERVAFGLDLEWEVGGARVTPASGGADGVHPGTVHGDVLVGATTRALDVPGALVQHDTDPWVDGAPGGTLVAGAGRARRVDARDVEVVPNEGIPTSIAIGGTAAEVVGLVALRLDAAEPPTALVRALVASSAGIGWLDLPRP